MVIRDLQLCPGDKSCVKVNKVPDDVKNKPDTTDGEAGKGHAWDQFDYYPQIVITETTQEKCGEVEPAETVEVTGFIAPEIVRGEPVTFRVNQPVVTPPEGTSFDDLSFTWYVDDSEIGTGKSVTHEFNDLSEHTIRLEASAGGEPGSHEITRTPAESGGSTGTVKIQGTRFGSNEGSRQNELSFHIDWTDTRDSGGTKKYAIQFYGNNEDYLGRIPGSRNYKILESGESRQTTGTTVEGEIYTPAETVSSSPTEVGYSDFTDYLRVDIVTINDDEEQQAASYDDCTGGVETSSCGGVPE